MKLVWLALVCACGLSAQTLSFTVHDNTGQTPDTTLPAAYQFASTRVAESTTVMLAIKNTGTSSITVITAVVGAQSGSLVASPNYTITGLGLNRVLAPNGTEYFNLNFTPTTTGQLFGYLQVATVEHGIFAVSTLEGTGLSPQFLLTYNNGTQLFPNSPSPLDFGSVSTSSSTPIVFTLTNETNAALTVPSISINAGVYASSAFSLSASTLPSSLAAGASGTFTITFAPGQTGLTTATMQIGSNAYPIEGTGIVVSDIDVLQISYVDATGVRTQPQAATPISFGQLTPGAAASTLTFIVANPATSFNAVSVSQISVTGGAFTLGSLPSLPASIQPGGQIQFTLNFNATSSGTYTGMISIGSRKFSLTGLAVISPVPPLSLHFSSSNLTSAQQVTVTVESDAPATQEHLGTLSMQFTPSLAGVSDDPAVVFLATGGRTLSLDLAQGASTATFQGSSALSFQTGTTAGTLMFTLSFVNTPPLTQSFTITPSAIHISSATAQREDPNLVVTINGFDNTYSAGKMSFTFYDLKGKAINSTPLAVDSTTTFHNYFFTNDQAGGSFAMQATFPVTGNVTQIGSVGVTLENSSAPTTTTLQFQ
jgi:hypothetical protein